jgi:alkylation response protein AidB-like acyl-CoA dehydrogenase
MSRLPPRMQDVPYHDMILPDEALKIRKKVRAFAEAEVVPLAARIANQEETKENFPFGLFHKLADEDFFRIPFPKQVGGLGLEYPVCATVTAVEELAYMSNSVAAIYDVHCILAGHALMYGSEYIQRRLEDDQSSYKVEAIYRDCKVAEIYEGTNEIQKLIIARNIFGKDLVG